MLARASGSTGVFAGVTSTHHVVLEEWTASGTRKTIVEHTRSHLTGTSIPRAFLTQLTRVLAAKQLGSFDLATLPANQEHAAVNGWNMLRLKLSGETASVWFNPTHADEAGPMRGLRLNATIAMPTKQAISGGMAAAVRGGAAVKVDYVGVYSVAA